MGDKNVKSFYLFQVVTSKSGSKQPWQNNQRLFKVRTGGRLAWLYVYCSLGHFYIIRTNTLLQGALGQPRATAGLFKSNFLNNSYFSFILFYLNIFPFAVSFFSIYLSLYCCPLFIVHITWFFVHCPLSQRGWRVFIGLYLWNSLNLMQGWMCQDGTAIHFFDFPRIFVPYPSYCRGRRRITWQPLTVTQLPGLQSLFHFFHFFLSVASLYFSASFDNTFCTRGCLDFWWNFKTFISKLLSRRWLDFWRQSWL